MALERADRVRETTTTTGTGTLNLDGADTGFQTFVSAVTDGATVRYFIESSDLLEWEVGEGVITDGTPDTLSRVTVFASSNAGSLVNFSAGTKTVALSLVALDINEVITDAKNFQFRQALINGNFDIWQRGTSFTSATSPANNDDVYTADRWNLISNGNDAVDISRESTEIPEGSTYSMKMDVETSAQFGIVQFLEYKDAKKLDGKTVSLSFAVKSSSITAIRAAVLSWAGTADSITSDIVSSWAATPTWAASWTSENTPADLTVTSSWTTVKIEGIVIDSATVNNLAIAIWLPNAESIGEIIYISQVQLNEGDVALTFQPKSYAEEYIDCKRYYELMGLALNGGWVSASAIEVSGNYTVEKRTTPTLTLLTTTPSAGEYGVSGRTGSGSAIALTSSNTPRGLDVQINGFSGATAFHPGGINTENCISANAEL